MRNRRRKDNRGITLVELLITIAIGGIVISAVMILLRQGMNSYSRQTISAQLQNEANIALNQISNAIMEANDIDVSNVDSNQMTLGLVTKQGTEGNAYIYVPEEKKLYVGVNRNDENRDLLCAHIEEFRVKILNSSVETQKSMQDIDGKEVEVEKIHSIHNPIRIEVSIKAEYKQISREVSRVTALRNPIKTFDSFKIEGKGLDTFPDKGALQNYFTD